MSCLVFFQRASLRFFTFSIITITSTIKSFFNSPTSLIGLAFHILINAPLLSGFLAYGDDTGGVDIPFRVYASAIFANNDLPIWYPNAGNGVPQISIEFVGNVFNPLGLLLAYFRPYDLISFAIENSLWRLIGYQGVYLLAKTWGLHPIGATAVAVTYIGSGCMSRAALAIAVFIGIMLAPWLLYGASSAILSRSRQQLLTSAGIIGLSAGIMSWSGGLVILLMAPALLGPTLIALALQSHRGVRRLLSSLFLAIIVCLLITIPILSQTLNGPTSHFSPTYRATESDMLAGHVKSIDFLGFFLVNPSYILDYGSDDLRPLYFSIIPLILILFTVPLFSMKNRSNFLGLTVMIILFILIHSPSWFLFKTYLPPLTSLTLSDNLLYNTLRPVIFLALPIVFLSARWGLIYNFTRFDKILILGAVWIILISTNNPIANYLRQNIPPFALVRHNYFYFWIVSLNLAIVGWKRLEAIISHIDDYNTSISFFNISNIRTLVRDKLLRSRFSKLPLHSVSFNITYMCIGLLFVLFLSAQATREGTTRPDFEFVGLFQLLWQFFLFIMVSIFLLFSLVSFDWLKASRGLILCSILSVIFLCFLGVSLRINQYVLLRLPISDSTRLSIDLFHAFFVTIVFSVSLSISTSKHTARLLVLFVIVSDMLIAIPRYLSDNERVATPQLGWPFSLGELNSGHASRLVKPDSGDGSLKSHFWLPFRGAMRTYPEVRSLRMEWGDAYNQWMHFPETWYEDNLSTEAFVPFGELRTAKSLPNATRAAIWGLPGEQIGGRGEAQDSKRNSPQRTPSVSEAQLFSKNCHNDFLQNNITSFGKVTTLLPTYVMSEITVDCERLMVFTDSWAPGWSLRIDGSLVSIVKVNGAIRGAHVPSGSHIVTWEYVTPYRNVLVVSVIVGIFVSLISIITPSIIPFSPKLSAYYHVSQD